MKTPSASRSIYIGNQLSKKKAIVVALLFVAVLLLFWGQFTFTQPSVSHAAIPISTLPTTASRSPSPTASQQASSSKLDLAKLPLSFVPNAGQISSQARFSTQMSGGTVFFAPSEVVLVLHSLHQAGGADNELQEDTIANKSKHSAPVTSDPASVLRMSFVKPNPNPSIVEGRLLPGKVNYFLDNDRSKWRTDLSTYDSITYRSLYPGISLEYSGTDGNVKGTYTISPGANPKRIHWNYTGAKTITVEANGDLQVVATEMGTTTTNQQPIILTEKAPVAWQEIRGQKTSVDVHYSIAPDGNIGFALGKYDPAYTLIIDPSLVYATFLGGANWDEGNSIAVDGSGNIYVTGSAETDFPTRDPIYGYTGGQQTFITKINPGQWGNASLIYSTYIGGSHGVAFGYAIAVDSSHKIYVVGDTNADNFPIATNTYVSTFRGETDGFLAKLNETGSQLLYSTYLGSTATDNATGLAVGSSGIAYVTGRTNSDGFPVANAYQGARNGGFDAFVAKLNTTVSGSQSLLYGTYLGGSADDYAQDIAEGATGLVYIAGTTASTNFPVASSFRDTNAGSTDAFVTKLNTTVSGSSGMVYSTYLGGNGDDKANGIAVDGNGYAYIGGVTVSSNFPVEHSYQSSSLGLPDAFITKLNLNGTSLVYSTYLGGYGYDAASDIALDQYGNVYLVGTTTANDFPVLSGYQGGYLGNHDAFVTELNTAGTSLRYSTYLGGFSSDFGNGIAVDTAGNSYVVGTTSSVNFPAKNAYQQNFLGSHDAFVAKLLAIPNVSGTPTTLQGDDDYFMFLGTSDDITADLKIGRYYGDVDQQTHHILSDQIDQTIENHAHLVVRVENIIPDDVITVSFAGVTGTLNTQSYSINIPSQNLLLPDKGIEGTPVDQATPTNTPQALIPISNRLTITHNLGPSGRRTYIQSVELTLRGLRPLVLQPGSEVFPYSSHWDGGFARNHFQYGDGGIKPDLWETPLPYKKMTFFPLRDGQASIQRGATHLSEGIKTAKQIFGVEKVNVVAHSLGNLWGREFVLNQDRENSVDKLVMLGAPHKGSPWGDRMTYVYNKCLRCLANGVCSFVDGWACEPFIRDYYKKASPAIKELRTSNMAQYNATYPNPAPCVSYIDQPGIWDLTPLSDGLVPVWSAYGEPPAYMHNDQTIHLTPITITTDTNNGFIAHSQLVTSSAVRDAVAPYLRMNMNTYILGGNTQCKGTLKPITGSLSHSKPAAVSSSLTPSSVTQWPSQLRTILSHEVQTTTISVDDAEQVQFSLIWFNPTSTLVLTLTDPLGQVITPTSNYSGSVYLPNLGGNGYKIQQPLPGIWKAIVEGQNTPNDGEPYVLGGEIQGGVVLTPAVSSDVVSVGQPITIRVDLRDPAPIAGAVVTASIVLMTNGSFITDLNLTEQTGGVYQGQFTPAAKGVYLVNISASGTNNTNHGFSHDTALQVEANSGAMLNGTYGEQAYDSTAAGVYDSLVVSATTVITDSGQYHLMADLTDTDGQVIAQSNRYYTETTGTEQLPMTFPGKAIGASAKDGPYNIRDLRLLQVISGTASIDEVMVAHLPVAYTTTIAYARSMWPRENVIQVGSATEQAVDTNNNSLYNYLEITATVDVLKAGVYNASLNLVAPDDTVIADTNLSNLELITGTNTVIAQFSGYAINTIGKDGPYSMRNMAIWQNGEEVSHIDVVLPQTQPYHSTDFEMAPPFTSTGWLKRGHS